MAEDGGGNDSLSGALAREDEEEKHTDHSHIRQSLDDRNIRIFGSLYLFFFAFIITIIS